MRDRLAFCSLALFSLLASTTAFAQWPLNGAPVSIAVSDQTFPASISDGAGGVIVAWQDFRNGTDYDIYVQRLNAMGTALWTANGVAICTADGLQQTPTIASDGAGGAIISWRDDRSFPFSPLPSIFAQRVNSSGVPQWTANGVSLCSFMNGRISPMSVADGSGGAIVTWEDHRGGVSNADIYAQRVNASGVVQWTANGVALCSALNDQVLPTIISDSAGGAIVTWDDGRNGLDRDIYAQRVSNVGTVLWTVDGMAICTAANLQDPPTIASDSAGGAIITWGDRRISNSDSDIYAQRVSAAGGVLWTANGVAVSTAMDVQGIPTIVADGSGGAIVTWYDFRSGNYDIYAQRMNASGVMQWATDGVALCTAADRQDSPAIVSAGPGSAIITWRDFRSLNFDIYAQRVSGLGVPQWTANGVALCTAPGSQAGQTIVTDGASGAIVAWQDARSGNSDIYAEQVSAGGQIPVAVRNTPSIAPLTVYANSPNPFSATTELEIGLRTPSDVHVEIYDVLGRRVNTLDVKQASAGWQRIPFSGRDASGRALASGVYFYRVNADGMTLTRKMVIAR